MGNGVAELHAIGYIHRDLKPENIVLNLNPLEVKIIDFDLACSIEYKACTAGRGTIGYHPEKVSWRDGSQRWDVWSLVALICEVDMPRDKYMRLLREVDCIKAVREHNKKEKTCANLGYLLLNTLFTKNYSEMFLLKDIL